MRSLFRIAVWGSGRLVLRGLAHVSPGWMALALCAAQPPPATFTLHLPSAKLGYPAAEYWAEIEGPEGNRLRAFAIYSGQDVWTVSITPEVAGTYRLLGVERSQGDQREQIALGETSQRRLEVLRPHKRAKPEAKTLVEVGLFETIFAAEPPWCLNDHSLIQGPDNTWHLFAITHPKPLDFFKDPGRRLAHATARSLRQSPWEAQPPAVTADWERHKEYLLWAPHVIREGDTYYMFVCVGDKQTHRYPLHLLTSPDLTNWTRAPENPLVVDGFDGRDPMVLKLKDQWVLYYTATTTPEGGNHIVACVTSRNLVHWSGRTVVFTHSRAGTFGGPTESPFVVRRGDNYYLFLCDNDWTEVYLSRDPFHWDFERQVGRIRSHASEVVRDVDGQWYISHAGWMSGPVRLAPLLWHDGLDNAPSNILPGRSSR